MNNLKSYTEYAVTTPTTDFVIGFDFNYGTDAVNVTVDGVPASVAGYSVIYLNSTTMRLSPAVPTGVVRLQRETDIDIPDNQFTAGAKFIASNMDENFTQIRHAQQEVRDGFEKLSEDTYEIIDTLQDVGQAAQDAADAAEQAAELANDAAAQVSDKVPKSATLPTYLTVAAGVDPVTGVAVGAYFNVRSSNDESYMNEYQNAGGSAVATGKSYPSGEAFNKLRDAHVTVDTISDLRLIPASRVQDIKSVTVLGYYSKGDGGGGPRRVWKAGPFIDNGGSVIVANSGGAWVFADEAPVHVKAFGAKGVAGEDDTEAFANAFASGFPTYSDSSCYHEIQRVVISSVIDEPYFNYKKVSSTLSVNFDGGGCTIKGKSMIGESYPYPKNGTGLAGDAWCWIFDFSHIGSVNFKNINITGALFDNIQEDTKPYIYGVQGTRMALNTMLSGVICYSVTSVDIDKIAIEKVAKGLRVYRTDLPNVKNVTISKVNDAFQFSDTTNGTYENLHSFHAKFNLAETRDGIYSAPGNIVDINGNNIYTIVPDTSNNSGIKGSGGHAFIEAGGQNNTYINCSDYGSSSDGFRTQGGVLYPKPKNIKTFNYKSEFAKRWAISMYADGESIQHINPVIADHGKLLNYVEPPATREEALQGCTDGDIENYWLFNQYSSTARIAAIRSAYSGMYIENINSQSGGRPAYTGTRFLSTTLHPTVYHNFLLCSSTLVGHKTEISGGNVEHIKSGQFSPVFNNISGSSSEDLSTGLLLSNDVNYTVESFSEDDANISAPNSGDRAVLVGLEGCSLDYNIQGGSITSRYISGYNSPTTSGVFGGKVTLNRVIADGEGFFINTNKAQPNNLVDARYNSVVFNSKPVLGRVISGEFQKTTLYECTKLATTPNLTDLLNSLSSIKQMFNGLLSYVFNVTTSGVIFNVPQQCVLQSVTPINRSFPDTIPPSSQTRYDQIGYYAVTNKFITSAKLGAGDIKIGEIMNSSGGYHELRYSVVSVLDDGTMDISIKCGQASIAGAIKILIDPINVS